MKLIKLQLDGFDWDAGNRRKIENRIPIWVVEDFFKQELLVKEDTRRQYGEIRFLAVGVSSSAQRPMFVAFTVRLIGELEMIRPISARFMHRNEVKTYEKKIKKLQKNK